MAGDDKDKRNGKKGRGGGGRDSGPGVKDVILEKPKLDSSGGYEVPISFLVVWGNAPPRETVNCQILVAGAPRGYPKTVRHDGKVYERPVLRGEDTIGLSVQLTWREGTRVIFLGDVELPKRKRKLEILGTRLDRGIIQVAILRLGKDGKPEVGKIGWWDFVERGDEWVWDFLEVEVPAESSMLSFHCRETAHTITFILPDDKEVQASVTAPGLKKPAEPQPEPKPDKPKPSPFLDAFSRGRKIGRSWFGKEDKHV